MRQAITGVIVQLEITQYNDANQVCGRMTTPEGGRPTFSAVEAEIPGPVMEWVQAAVNKMGG